MPEMLANALGMFPEAHFGPACFFGFVFVDSIDRDREIRKSGYTYAVTSMRPPPPMRR